MDNNEKQKAVAIAMSQLMDAMANVGEDDLADLKSASSGPVGLRDTAKFNLNIKMLSTDEITNARRELVSAISAEKYAEGFMMAVQLMKLLGGLA